VVVVSFFFLFSRKEERDLTRKFDPYFMGSKGMFLSHWTLDFDTDIDIMTAFVWVRLLHLPIIF
jgi:hypothetical protein